MSKTARFAWVDRATAARDLIQLAYHAPPYTSRLAIQLLQAIRSPTVVPELEAIVLDQEREIWERRYALRAIAATPGDYHMPQFAPLASAHLKALIRYDRERGMANYSDLHQNDLLDDLMNFVDRHPSNRQWFFDAIAAHEESPVVARFLSSSLDYYHHSDEFKRLAAQYLTSLLEKNLDWLDWDTVCRLYDYGDQVAKQWLDERLDQVVKLCLQQNFEVGDCYSLLNEWLILRDALIRERPEIGETLSRRNQNRQAADPRIPKPDYHQSPGYQELERLYNRALEGDRKACEELRRMSARPRKNIPKQAVAAYFLGKLRQQYDVLELLCALARNGRDTDRENTMLNFPIRFEAGEALRDSASPAAWETLVDAFFIRPANVLNELQIDWIAHLTDVLSGIETEYSGVHLGDKQSCWWFHALGDDE